MTQINPDLPEILENPYGEKLLDALTEMITQGNASDLVITALRSINPSAATAYTPVLADAFKTVTLNNASPVTVTLPSNATVPFAIGTRIDFVGLGAGLVTFAAGGGVVINSADLLFTTRAQFSAVSALKTGTNTWVLVGDLA